MGLRFFRSTDPAARWGAKRMLVYSNFSIPGPHSEGFFLWLQCSFRPSPWQSNEAFTHSYCLVSVVGPCLFSAVPRNALQYVPDTRSSLLHGFFGVASRAMMHVPSILWGPSTASYHIRSRNLFISRPLLIFFRYFNLVHKCRHLSPF